MNARIRNKIYNRAARKMQAYLGDKRSTYEIAKEENVLTPLEKRVFLQVQEKMIRITRETIKEIETDELAVWYQTVFSEFDADGFKMFRAAESILGKFDYAHFAYEDNRGRFENMDGFQMLPYLLVQHSTKLGHANYRMDRWEIVAPGYEECVNFTIVTTPEYKEFERKLFTTLYKEYKQL